ncbi:hypothetical protein [Salisaeta longa]|uniref:hypothetical protein n=1 Tax=Salisaeta longa TaxID=503170 RepID=UPI0003B4D532|nr:hypothetical protein [Salisaeta longa]
MPSLTPRARWVLGLVGGFVLVSILLINTVPFFGMVWGALSGGPGLGLIRDIRSDLLAQDPFVQTLAAHEHAALQRYRASGTTAYQRRYLVKVNLAPFGLPGFHDVFAVRVRTDIVKTQPYTAFLVRPGVAPSENDAPFFSRQCDTVVCKKVIRGLVAFVHGLVNWGILSTYRLNITESDATSSVMLGTTPVSTSTWARQSRAMHRNERGISFTSPTP